MDCSTLSSTNALPATSREGSLPKHEVAESSFQIFRAISKSIDDSISRTRALEEKISVWESHVGFNTISSIFEDRREMTRELEATRDALLKLIEPFPESTRGPATKLIEDGIGDPKKSIQFYLPTPGPVPGYFYMTTAQDDSCMFLSYTYNGRQLEIRETPIPPPTTPLLGPLPLMDDIWPDLKAYPPKPAPAPPKSATTIGIGSHDSRSRLVDGSSRRKIPDSSRDVDGTKPKRRVLPKARDRPSTRGTRGAMNGQESLKVAPCFPVLTLSPPPTSSSFDCTSAPQTVARAYSILLILEQQPSWRRGCQRISFKTLTSSWYNQGLRAHIFSEGNQYFVGRCEECGSIFPESPFDSPQVKLHLSLCMQIAAEVLHPQWLMKNCCVRGESQMPAKQSSMSPLPKCPNAALPSRLGLSSRMLINRDNEKPNEQ
ncbi:hypothetical protein MKZ38_007801 [Zalerion maritima]|uniref:Uncharacterized protein n=1 Tax=Zalerion maritima TaxID=339359 RepID=A0AAD5WMT3_9PEZI|nr:hypothetical protein MKZ38_007801 [Zalerion maritima]